MKTFRKSLLVMMAMILVIACVFTMASCKKNKDDDHEHEYTSVVTAPTCTADGFTTYTCSCGETYTADPVAATGHTMETVAAVAGTCATPGYSEHEKCSVCGHEEGKTEVAGDHDYESKITVYPTVDTNGTRTLTCSACGDVKTETIDAFSASVPAVADVLAAIIGEAQYTLSAAEDSEIVMVRELSDYTYGDTGYKRFVVFNLAEATLSGKDATLYGHIKLELTLYEADIDATTSAGDITFGEDATALKTATLYLYVNGDAISLEMTDPDGDVETESASLNDEFYAALGEMFGLDADMMVELSYIARELGELAPIAEAIFNAIATADVPTISEDYVAGLGEMFSLIGANIVEATTEGDNTVYTLNLEAFGALIDEVSGKTVAAYLTEVFGEDVLDALFDFVRALPDKTVKEIADAAITFAEEAGVPVADIFTAIEILIHDMTGAEISIYEQIDANADLTLAEILMMATAGEFDEEDITEFKSQLGAMLDQAYAVKFDDILAGVTPGVTFDDLKAMLAAADEAITAELTFSAEGALVAIDLAYADATLSADVAADGTVTVAIDTPTADVTATLGAESGSIVLTADDDSVTFTYGSAGITLIGYDDGTKILDGRLEITDNGPSITNYWGDLIFNGVDYFYLYAYTLDGELQFFQTTISGYETTYDHVYDDVLGEWVSTPNKEFKQLIDAKYEKATDTCYITIEDVTFDFDYEVTDVFTEFTMTGTVDGVVEFEGTVRFADGTIYYEAGNGEFAFFRAGIATDPATGKLIAIIYEINSPTYDDYNGDIIGVEEIIAIEYQAGDATTPDYLAISIDGMPLILEFVEIEGGIRVNLGLDEEELGYVAISEDEGVVTLDAYIAMAGEVYVDGTVSIGAGTIDVDIDKILTDSYDAYDYEDIYDDGVYVETIETVLYNVIKYASIDLELEFTVA